MMTKFKNVKSNIYSMSLDEKIGQLFCPIGSSFDTIKLKNL